MLRMSQRCARTSGVCVELVSSSAGVRKEEGRNVTGFSKAQLDAVAARAVDITADLIRLDTTADTLGEIDGLSYVAGLFADRHDFRVITPRDAAGEPTGLLLVPREVRGTVLLLSGHIDTVRAVEEGWEYGPWSGVVDADGWLHGRGASDMKSGLAAQISAVLAAPEGAQVALAVSRNEENGCLGSAAIIEAIRAAGLSVGAIIVGEPTDGEIVLGHKGPFWFTVTTRGKAAHGSTPERGVSAIAKLAHLLVRAETELPLRTHPYLGAETINVGIIEGGTMRNIVPDFSRAEIDVRLVDADTSEIRGWWLAQPETDELIVDVEHPGLATDANDAWVQSLVAPVAVSPVGFGTEAGPFSAGLDVSRVVVWGPGPKRWMHSVDERVRVVDIAEAARGYLAAIEGWAKFAGHRS